MFFLRSKMLIVCLITTVQGEHINTDSLTIKKITFNCGQPSNISDHSMFSTE